MIIAGQLGAQLFGQTGVDLTVLADGPEEICERVSGGVRASDDIGARVVDNFIKRQVVIFTSLDDLGEEHGLDLVRVRFDEHVVSLEGLFGIGAQVVAHRDGIVDALEGCGDTVLLDEANNLGEGGAEGVSGCDG